MGKTAIGWTDMTWNCVRGCSRVSEGCRHCYAEAQAARIVRMGKGRPTAYDGLVKLVNGEPRWTGAVRLVTEHLADPLKWRAPRRVFVNSMSDLFHESLTNEQIAAVFGVMAAAPQHTFQCLTKRADRMRAWFEWCDGALHCIQHAIMETLDDKRIGDVLTAAGLSGLTWPLRNVWPGVSVEDRKHGVPRIEDLRAVPATVRMLSCEPLLEDLGTLDLRGIGWCITGCESGPYARPAKDAWFTSIEEQCRAAGVPYFLKQQMIDGKLVHDFPGQQAFPEVPRG